MTITDLTSFLNSGICVHCLGRSGKRGQTTTFVIELKAWSDPYSFLATGARWSEAEGLTSREVRGGRIHFARTKSSKNRTVPISEGLQKQIRAAMPFGDCYKKFGDSVDAVKLELPAG